MFAPLVGLVIVLFVILGSVAVWTESRNMAQTTQRDVDAAARLVQLRLTTDVDTMRIAMDPLLEDEAILARFMAGDRDGLLALVEGRFARLREEHGISHMYFVGPDRVSFLRVHQPDNYGEVIERFTMRQAQRDAAVADGLELGILGIPSLRVVSPLRHQGRVVGYFELGREIDEYAADVRSTLDIGLDVLIDKRLVDEVNWARGQALLGREADWAQFERYVAAGILDPDTSVVLDEVVSRVAELESGPVRVSAGDGRHFAVGAQPLIDASGDAIGLLVVSLDVTRSVHGFRRTMLGLLVAFVVFAIVMVLLVHGVVRRAEHSLARAEAVERQVMSELEDRVRERTAQLDQQIAEREAAEAQLRQAQKMEVIGQLTGGVAHDFNNLLTAIYGNLELAAQEDLSPDAQEFIREAMDAANNAATLTHQLLAFSRKQPLQPHRVDPRELVAQMETLLRRTLGERVDLEIVESAGQWKCEVDGSQLKSAILNLALNARDAMPDGGKITIETRNVRISEEYASEQDGLTPGQYVLVAVSDTGVGMTPELQRKVFEPFFTTKGLGRGSGLGLSMVYGFIKQSRGHVAIYSEPGVGTTMKLYLPRSTAQTAAHTSRIHTTGPVPRGGGEVVLVVEDNAPVRRVTVRALESLGYVTIESADAEAALLILRGDARVDLLLTDVVLPGETNSTQLVTEALELRTNLAIIYTSGYTENAVIHHGRLDAGVQLLEKPFTPDGLGHRVHAALRQHAE